MSLRRGTNLSHQKIHRTMPRIHRTYRRTRSDPTAKLGYGCTADRSWSTSPIDCGRTTATFSSHRAATWQERAIRSRRNTTYRTSMIGYEPRWITMWTFRIGRHRSWMVMDGGLAHPFGRLGRRIFYERVEIRLSLPTYCNRSIKRTYTKGNCAFLDANCIQFLGSTEYNGRQTTLATEEQLN